MTLHVNVDERAAMEQVLAYLEGDPTGPVIAPAALHSAEGAAALNGGLIALVVAVGSLLPGGRDGLRDKLRAMRLVYDVDAITADPGD